MTLPSRSPDPGQAWGLPSSTGPTRRRTHRRVDGGPAAAVAGGGGRQSRAPDRRPVPGRWRGVLPAVSVEHHEGPDAVEVCWDLVAGRVAEAPDRTAVEINGACLSFPASWTSARPRWPRRCERQEWRMATSWPSLSGTPCCGQRRCSRRGGSVLLSSQWIPLTHWRANSS